MINPIVDTLLGSVGRFLQQLYLENAGWLSLIVLTWMVVALAVVTALTREGRGADVAVEAVGLPATWEQTITQLRPGGTAVLFGGAKSGSSISVDTVAMHYKEYTIKGVFHHTPNYVRTAVDLLTTRTVDGRLMLTEHRPLERLVESLDDMSNQKGLKYAISCQ